MRWDIDTFAVITCQRDSDIYTVDVKASKQNYRIEIMEICGLCFDLSKNAFQNVETVQFGDEFIAISEMTKIFKDLEPVNSAV